MAHEIGHAIFHPKSSCFFINENNYISKIKSEYEATVFAAEFLIDDLPIDRFDLDGFSLEQLASSYVSVKELTDR